MIFNTTDLKDAWLIDLEPRRDSRGAFTRTFCREEFNARGMATDFVQQNMSTSTQRGTLRGMHYQRRPHTEAKLVRCVRGAIMDVIVDLRGDSPTYLCHQQFELTADNWRQLYVPPGFGHSFLSLTDDVEVNYVVSAPYMPDFEGGVRWNDPALRIDWPLPVSSISDKDAAWPLLDTTAKSIF